jgi:nicotinamidase/pyrazinamidase
MNIKIDKSSALIVVDVQKDFCQGGTLPVPRGDEVVPVLNRYIRKFEEAGAQIYATRDWHPSNHVSFKSQSGPWPSHCVQNTEGAEFHRDLLLPIGTVIVSKADSLKETYSGFDETNLEEDLKRKKIGRVFVGGLATDYCVLNTVLDAIRLGFETFLLKDAIKGVNVQVNDSKRAIKEMKSNGVHIIRNINAII